MRVANLVAKCRRYGVGAGNRRICSPSSARSKSTCVASAWTSPNRSTRAHGTSEAIQIVHHEPTLLKILHGTPSATCPAMRSRRPTPSVERFTRTDARRPAIN